MNFILKQEYNVYTEEKDLLFKFGINLCMHTQQKSLQIWAKKGNAPQLVPADKDVSEKYLLGIGTLTLSACKNNLFTVSVQQLFIEKHISYDFEFHIEN